MWRVDHRLKDDSLSSLSLNGSDGRSSKVLVTDASSAPVGSSATIRTVSADETDVEVVISMSVSGATKALVLFCDAVGVKPSPFDRAATNVRTFELFVRDFHERTFFYE